MHTNNLIYLLALICLLGFGACKKEGLNPLSDFRPDIPVTVSNVFDYRPNPTVKASKADDKITITLQIPANSGRTIKEISKVAAATTANFTPIQTATTVSTNGLYSNTPIPGNGTSVTFETSFTEYKTKTATTTNPASNALLTRAFYFMITLDNGETILPQFVRVWVVD
ncbi:hypothetical protein HRH25_16705 [Flavisolibacter sp. BT320]|jgi:hypothetical protein|nr:hypothetical protein [Flavisolibacter longurius]